MALESTIIQTKLVDKFDNQVSNFMQQHDIFTFDVAPESNLDVMRFLRDDETLRFNFLTDICGVHYPDATKDKEFAVVYHMHNWLDNTRVRFKCFISLEHIEINSVTSLFSGANWQERETYDFYGIIFKGHPQLKRILNMDEMTSFPMRKEFPLEDGGRTDKDDRFFGRTTDNC
jgi:NADH-quinone oxidoreductase subunit C